MNVLSSAAQAPNALSPADAQAASNAPARRLDQSLERDQGLAIDPASAVPALAASVRNWAAGLADNALNPALVPARAPADPPPAISATF